MTDRLLNLHRREAQRVASQIALPKVGIVTSYDPSNYSAKVRLQPEDTETGWLPIRTPWSGNGWGMFCPPTPGDEVEIQHQEGGKQAAYVSLRAFGDRFRPLSVPSGEFWLVHKSGARFTLTSDGKGHWSDASGAAVVLNNDGTITSSATFWNHTGNFNATKFYAQGTPTIPDGIYCTGLGLTQNGFITVQGGMITAIQEAQ